jgi:hypothetical protein
VLTSDGHIGKVYTVTGPQALTHGEIAEQLGMAAGREVVYRPVSGEQARAGMLAAGLDAWRVDGLIELYAFYAAGYATATSDAVPVLSGPSGPVVRRFRGRARRGVPLNIGRPARTTYNTASTTARRECFSGRQPSPGGCHGGSTSAHSSSVRSEG